MTNKKMAYGVWTVCALWALVTIISVISMRASALSIITNLVAYVFIALLGYTIYWDRNDRLTMITVILVAVFTFDLGGLLAIVLRLALRKKDSENTRKLWFLPAAVSVVLSLIVGLLYSTVFSALSAVSMILKSLYYLVFGYWFIKYLPVN